MTTLRSEYIRTGLVLLLGLELSQKSWKLCLGDGRQRRVREVKAGDVLGVMHEIGVAKRKFGMAEETKVVACYEAGRDGFWPYWRLQELGVRTLVMDAGSVAQKGKKRRRKNDRLDALQLLGLLLRYELCGETDVFSVCRVPSREAEDERRMSRERATEAGGDRSPQPNPVTPCSSRARPDGDQERLSALARRGRTPAARPRRDSA